MTLISYLFWGGHLPLGKDRHKGDHLVIEKTLKPNVSAVLGGHFTPFIHGDHGGHLVTPF